jgi:hypothetical protein
VTNIGTAYLDSVEVNDAELGVVNASIGALAPGETKTIILSSRACKVNKRVLHKSLDFLFTPVTQQKIAGVQIQQTTQSL